MNLITAFRALRKAPGEVVLAIVALGAGIGLVTTLFSLLSAVALTPLPFPEGDRLVHIGSVPSETAEYRERQTGFEGVAGVAVTGVNAVAEGSPRRYRAAYVSSNFFDVLQVKPLIGAGFQKRHERSEPGVVLSHSTWKKDYGEDPAAVGRTLLVNGRPLTITAVMAEGFAFPRKEEIWIAWDHTASNAVQVEGRGSDRFLLARLQRNVSLAHAETETNQIAQRLHEAAGQKTPHTFVSVARYADRQIKGEVKQLLAAILTASFFVLLIACANVANLNLARASKRMTELAIRSALGATQAQLIRLALAESLLLATAGGVAGLVFAAWALDGLWSYIMLEAEATGGPPPWIGFNLDSIVLTFTAGLILLTTIAAGLFPALKAARANLESALRDSSSSTSLRAGRFSKGLIHVQLASSVLLLVGAGLTASTIFQVGKEMRFDPARILSARIALSDAEYPNDETRQRFLQRVAEELRHTPGIEAAAITTAEFIQRPWHWQVSAGGRGSDSFGVAVEAITPDYFDVFRSQILHGRSFSRQDNAASMIAGIVNARLAERLWPGENPVGKRLRAATGPFRDRWLAIAGVAQDIAPLSAGRKAPNPTLFVPLAQVPFTSASLVVRTQGDATAAVPNVRAVIAGLNTQLPLFQLHTAAEIAAMESVGIRLPAILLAACGISALWLAAIGAYGVLSLAAKQRTQEIGIRLALGADRGDIFRMLLRQGFGHIAAGIAVGLLLAAALERVLSFFFGAFEHQLAIYLAVVVVMAAVGLTALVMPAVPASRLNPVKALRAD